MAGITSWDTLPLLVTSNVFRYLGNNDRFNASLACKNWCKALRSPDIWRRVTVEIREENEKANDDPFKLVEEVGEWAREIYILLVSKLQSPYYCTSNLFNSLHQSKVTKFVVVNFRTKLWSNAHLHPNTWSTLTGSIIKFIETQTGLEWFDMSRCSVPLASGLCLLEMLSLAGCNTLKHLDIRGFFDNEETVLDNGMHGVQAFRTLMSRFTQLRTVKMNYHCLDKEILLGLTQNCAASLQNLTLELKVTDAHAHQVSSLTWDTVRERCPRLRVRMDLLVHEEGNLNVAALLPEEMPLTALSYVNRLQKEDVSMSLIKQLHYFTESLEELWLYFKSDLVPEDILDDLLTECSNLKDFDEFYYC